MRVEEFGTSLLCNSNNLILLFCFTGMATDLAGYIGPTYGM